MREKRQKIWLGWATSTRLMTKAEQLGIEGEVIQSNSADAALYFDSPEALERAIEKLGAE